MTIDLNVKQLDDTFIDDIDDIIEETMVQMFILHPKESEALKTAQEHAAENSGIFYSVPLELIDDADENCVGINLSRSASLDFDTLPYRPLFIDENELDDTMVQGLSHKQIKGIILNATGPHHELEHFYLSIGPEGVKQFDSESLNALPMDRILLQSGYPDSGFDEIYLTAKVISDAMCRPEQSIIARATRHSLQLLGFSKG